MNNLNIRLANCYGIQALDYEFDFTPSRGRSKVHAIYAPNGLMKTSFTRTFEDLSKGELPKEERYGRVSSHAVEADGIALARNSIYVLKSEIDISSESSAITNILVKPENKAEYDRLLLEIESLKTKLINSLQKSSKVKKSEVEHAILKDCGVADFSTCIKTLKNIEVGDELDPYDYSTIFDPKALEVMKSPEFLSKSREFNERYQELFDQVGTIYEKGVFNPTKADASFTTLKKQGYFAGGHRVHLRGDTYSIDQEELDRKMNDIHASIDGDGELKKLRVSLAKNAQTQALTELIEILSGAEVKCLLEWLKPENQSEFRKKIWAFHIQKNPDVAAYLETSDHHKARIVQIESDSALVAPRWTQAIELFNDRFLDMPFTLSVANPSQAALGKEQARLKFTFVDGDETVECSRSDAKIQTLSQGERRALYLLNFIFEVEDRKTSGQDALFIIDDIADSFDYKNKHAIIQYLEDLSEVTHFHQIILTHNFDFFRTLAINFVHRDRCLMANRGVNNITLSKAEGIKNYFIGVWKARVDTDGCILCATIPFTRNLIEYTKGEADVDYLKLTSLLHWKMGTDQISVGDYLVIYNRLFNTRHVTTDTRLVKDLLFEKADEISGRVMHDGLKLEDKVLLSIAIRMRSEMFLTNELRRLKSDDDYWCPSTIQFGNIMKEFILLDPTATAKLRTLEKVSITVSSNIHLNSFMYEPILDLTVDHLVNLYLEVGQLGTGTAVTS